MRYRFFPVLTGIFVTCLIESNNIAGKPIAVGPFFLTAAVVIFPLSYIFGDILTEVYGYGRARQVIWIGPPTTPRARWIRAARFATMKKRDTMNRRRFVKAATLGALSLSVFRRAEHELSGAEPAALPGETPILPDAQVGSLYPFVQKTAEHSTCELSFLHDRFSNIETWKREARGKVRELLRYDPPLCAPRACRRIALSNAAQ